MNRRTLLQATLGLCALPVASFAQSPSPAARLRIVAEPYFTTWFDAFYARALAAGAQPDLLDRELAGLAADPRVAALDSMQPEFARPVSDYIRGVTNEGRIAIGRARRGTVTAFGAIEQTYGVPRDILMGIWAMESGFGAQQGDMDILRSLATLAAAGRRRVWAEGELIAALRILGAGEISRSRLKGSWAGAMGQTQMLPSTYLDAAVDGDGDGKRDIWTSAPDALASAAHLLAKAGWRRGEDWAREVILPADFDFGLSEGPQLAPSAWKAKGVTRADRRVWSEADGAAACTLLLPCGAGGPAFLALPNHFVIRRYNNSLAYALGVGLLADRFGGGGPLVTPWPHETALSLSDRMAAQTALARQGFSPGQPDGVIGLGTRQALRAWQKAHGLPADGYLSPAMIQRLKGQTLTPS